jgi:DNA integrity scanning protein DisA with diadenylate cyclase activity
MFVMGGQYIGASLNSDLIISIFQKNSPLHDGAILIHNQEIRMAQCILHVSENKKMPDGTGLRHRSGLGIAEQTDAIAIIISEQTGSISLAYDGKLEYDISKADFEKELKRLIHHKKNKKAKPEI